MCSILFYLSHLQIKYLSKICLLSRKQINKFKLAY